MTNELFTNRFERKYMLNKLQCEKLHLLIETHLKRDPYTPEGMMNHVFNIYYDTENYAFIRNSISKPTYKDKFRLRSYHMPVNDEDIVYLEIKKKYDGRVNKRRIELTYKDAKKYLNEGIKPNNLQDEQVFNEINYLLKREGQLFPKVYIAYDRIAYFDQTNTLRVSFDSNIRFRSTNLSLTSDQSDPILADPDGCLMEVKSTQNFPLWLVKELSSLTVYSQRFSKYGTTYQQILQGGKTYDYLFLDDRN